MKLTLLIVIALSLQGKLVQGQTQLQGKVTESNTGEAVLFATIALFEEGLLVKGTNTDFDGNYNFAGIEQGSYTLKVSYLGLKTARISILIEEGEKTTIQDVVLEDEEMGICGYVYDWGSWTDIPLVDFSNTTSGQTYFPNDRAQGKTHVLVKRKSCLKGTVFFDPSGETLLGVVIKVFRKGKLVSGVCNEIDGNYEICGLKKGKYEIEYSCTGYQSRKDKIKIKAGGDYILNVRMKERPTDLM